MGEGSPTPNFAEIDATNAENARKQAFYTAAREVITKIQDEMDAPDTTHPRAADADKLKFHEPRILTALDEKTGGDASKVTEELVMEVFDAR